MKKAFTLIELLIVIAIIAILALIAIPNFLEAQVRAKVARVQSDLRTLATALEAYYVDYNQYVYRYDEDALSGHHYLNYSGNMGTGPTRGLTTPVAYMAMRRIDDPFGKKKGENNYKYLNFLGAAGDVAGTGAGGYTYTGATNVLVPTPVRFNAKDSKPYQTMWGLISCGPDRDTKDAQAGAPEGGTYDPAKALEENKKYDQLTVKGVHGLYDPTNGTVSQGNIWRMSTPVDR